MEPKIGRILSDFGL